MFEQTRHCFNVVCSFFFFFHLDMFLDEIWCILVNLINDIEINNGNGNHIQGGNSVETLFTTIVSRRPFLKKEFAHD